MYINYKCEKMSNVRNEKGFITILIALALPLIISVMGFCLDGSLLLYYDAKLSMAAKFAAITATSVNTNIEGNLVITADETFVMKILKSNMEGAMLVDYSINPNQKNKCTVSASAEVPFIFMKIFGIESKTLVESYTAERNL